MNSSSSNSGSSSSNSTNIGSKLLARYPFVEDAGNYLKLLDYRLEEFDDPTMSNVIDRATARVVAAMRGVVYDPYNVASVDEEVVSFILACIMVKASKVKALYRRFALSEARRAEVFLVDDFRMNTSGDEMGYILNNIFKGLFAIDVIYSHDHSTFMIKVEDYLKYSTNFHDEYWRLSNRILHKGYVHLNTKDMVRLIRDEIYALIIRRLERINVEYDNLPEALKKRVNALKSMMLEIDGLSSNNNVYVERRGYPPCIVNILKALEQGNNPSHTARVLLATYMLGIGKSVEEVCELFKNAPDYNERVTRYQVEHLAGLRGNRVRYSCPSCSKVESQGLCFKSDECNGIINPLQFGRRHGSSAGRNRMDVDVDEGVGSEVR
ncbi:MAG: hypothetical protein QXY85_06840 [Candidatus Nitrosocaldus sp.]